MIAQEHISAGRAQTRGQFVGFTVVAAVTTATAAFASTTLSLPLWAMFIGWVACFIMSLRVIPIANNILSYFLGLIGYLASHLEPALSTFLELGATFALGSFAAWMANTIESRLTRAA